MHKHGDDFHFQGTDFYKLVKGITHNEVKNATYDDFVRWVRNLIIEFRTCQ